MIQWKHRLVSLLVCAAMLFSLCPTAAWGEEETGGNLDNGLHWSLDNGTLTITGTGEMPDFKSNSLPPWDNFKTSITRVVIEKGVTSVGEQAFLSCTALTSVEFPNTLTAIQESAFFGCTALTSVEFPSTLKELGG